MNIYQLNPAPVVQEEFYSRHIHSASQPLSIISKSAWVRNPILPSMKEKVIREVMRPVRKLGTALKRSLRGSLKRSVYLKVNYCGTAGQGPALRFKPAADDGLEARTGHPPSTDRQSCGQANVESKDE